MADGAELGEARKYIRELEDLQHRWEGFYMRLQGTMKNPGARNFDVPMMRPDKSIIAFYDKAAKQD